MTGLNTTEFIAEVNKTKLSMPIMMSVLAIMASHDKVLKEIKEELEKLNINIGNNHK